MPANGGENRFTRDQRMAAGFSSIGVALHTKR